jgi:transglutaminase-like putative cysteine protease
MQKAEQRFRRLAFFQVLIGNLAFCISEGQPLLLMVVGLACVGAWFVTEGPWPTGLPRPLLNIGAVLIVGLVLLEYRITRGARPVAIGGHLTLGLQVLILYGKRGRREYAQLAVLSPLQMISASVLPGGVSLIYAGLLIIYGLVTLMTAIAYQVKRAGDHVFDSYKKTTRKLETPTPAAPEPSVGPYHRLQLRMTAVAIGAVCAVVASAVFVVVPRSQQSDLAGAITRPAASRQAGYSQSVDLVGGSIGEGSPEPVLNIALKHNGVPYGGEGTHWLVRGSALDQYSPIDRRWTRSQFQANHDLTLPNADEGVTLRPNSAGASASADITLRRTAEQSLFTVCPVDGPVAVVWFRTPSVERVKIGMLDQQLSSSSPTDSVHTYAIRYWLQGTPNQPNDPRLINPRFNGTGVEAHVPSGARRGPGSRRRGQRRQNALVQQEALLLDWRVEREQVRALAAGVLRDAGYPTDLADADADTRLAGTRALRDYLRNTYRYTTDNPVAGGRDPVAAFLFEHRAGHCELFASALCAMCRAVGVPARVITGFRASEYNAIGGYYIVRQSHAHAWTEVQLGATVGWHTLDATPPAEVDRQHLASTGWFAGLREVYDHLEFQWIASIITYDQNSQEQILGGLGAFVTQGPDRWFGALSDWSSRQTRNFELSTLGYFSVGIIVIALIAALFSLGRLLILRRRRMAALQLKSVPRTRRRALARQLRFYITMLEMLERHGHLRPHWQSPYGFAKQLAEKQPMRFDPVVALTELFYEVRFGYRLLDTDRRARVKLHLRRLEHTLAAGDELAVPGA